MSAENPSADQFSLPYPPADITPSEFEAWVADLYQSVSPRVMNLRVTPHEVVAGVDGMYDLDATVRYEWAGLEFLVLVEAKRHSNPIKRELVASLHSKILSTGAHKGVMFATASFQRGALKFAEAHLPTFVGFSIAADDDDSFNSTIVSSEYVDYLTPVLLANQASPEHQ